VTARAVAVPLRVRVAVAHAAVQQVADRAGIEVLHIKGPALDPALAFEGREGTDADVLVRRSDATDFVRALERSGWQVRSRFENSSAFEHSATLWHELWGYVDVHRHFPGIELPADDAFQHLWGRRETRDIAGFACAVPDVSAQALVLVLHAARSGGSPRARQDVRVAWESAPEERRAAVRALVGDLDAGLAFAAATGGLEAYRGHRGYELWRLSSGGGTRLAEWRARVKAAPTRREAVRVVVRSMLVNRDHLAMVRGHQPTMPELVVEFFARPGRGLAELWRSHQRRDR
jgi:hypothetical protein